MIGDDLHLDVPRLLDVFFEIDAARCRRRLRPRCGLAERAVFSARSLPATRMPLPPPPAVALISTGKPISCATRTASASSSIRPSLPGTTGTLALRAILRAAFLSPSGSMASRRRADELDLAAPADLGEVRVLGEEAVAGVNRLDVADLGRADDLVDLQVALGALRRADADGFVGQLQVLAAARRPRCRRRPSRCPAPGRRG